MSRLQLFEAKFIPEPNSGCWLWLGATTRIGYGRFNAGYRIINAHRYAYQVYRGVMLPSDIEVDHLCRNKACVNPDHLEAVTHDENMRRRRGKNIRTACSRGHPLSGDNLAEYPGRKPGLIVRCCRICLNATAARSRAKRRR